MRLSGLSIRELNLIVMFFTLNSICFLTVVMTLREEILLSFACGIWIILRVCFCNWKLNILRGSFFRSCNCYLSTAVETDKMQSSPKISIFHILEKEKNILDFYNILF